MRAVEGNEIYFVCFSFFGILWLPPLFARPGKYIKIANVTDDHIEFDIRDASYAKMFASLNGAIPQEEVHDKKDDGDITAFGA
jgi:hypothetical protein